jgi:hypothetical protein
MIWARLLPAVWLSRSKQSLKYNSSTLNISVSLIHVYLFSDGIKPSSDRQNIKRICWQDVSYLIVIYLFTRFHMPSLSGSLYIVIRSRASYMSMFRAVTVLLFYTLLYIDPFIFRRSIVTEFQYSALNGDNFAFVPLIVIGNKLISARVQIAYLLGRDVRTKF